MPVIKTILKEFAENTSAHGVKNIVAAKGWFIKVIWLVLFVGASSMILFNASRLVDNYIRKPATPTTSIKTKSIYFPTVTICNLNPSQYSKIKNVSELYSIVLQLADLLQIPMEFFSNKGGEEVPEVLPPELPVGVNLTVLELVEQFSENFLLRLNSFGRKTIQSLSQPIENLLVACSFAGVPCTAEDFYPVLNIDYGTCYQFPNYTKYPNGIKMFSAGPLFGLSLVLNINQPEYVPFVTPAAGVRVRIHEFGSEFYMLEQGQSLPPGFETSIGIRPVVTTRLSAPFSDCDPTNEFADILGCQRNCLETAIGGTCLCTRLTKRKSKGIPTYDYHYIPEEQSRRACTFEDIVCIKDVLQAKKAGYLICSYCKYPCRKYVYKTTTSMMRYPSSNYDPALRYILNQWKSDEDKMYSETQTRQNIISLKVFFSDFEIEINEEAEAYPTENLLSDIGGQLGLWLGISVLSVCECLQLVYSIVCRMFQINKSNVVHAPEVNSGNPDLKQKYPKSHLRPLGIVTLQHES